MKKIFLALMGSFVLASCGNNQKQAVAYNNNLVKIQQEVGVEAQKFGQLVQTTDSAQAYKLVANLSAYIKDEEKKAAALQFDGEDFGMRTALLNGFRFFDNALGNEFKKILALRFAAAPPADAREQMQQIVTDIQKKGQNIDRKFTIAQRRFAEKYNIILQQQ